MLSVGTLHHSSSQMNGYEGATIQISTLYPSEKASPPVWALEHFYLALFLNVIVSK